MASEEPGQELRIGSALKDARRRAGLDIRTVEERTKIRTRYLRALEAEEWSALPGHAYVKGFLRTYANLLGLDGEALVDTYRRTVEGPQASPVPLGDGLLQARRRQREPGELRGPPSRLWIVGGVILLIAAGLLVLGLTGGDDEPERGGKGDRERRQGEGERQGGGGEGARGGQEQETAETVTMRLVANTDGLQVCLLAADSEQPLIDGFAGSAGSEDVFEAERFQLRFPFGYDLGQFDLFVGGERVRLEELEGPVAFNIGPPRRVQQVDEPSTSCP
jgi:Helix-turn-helix domain